MMNGVLEKKWQVVTEERKKEKKKKSNFSLTKRMVGVRLFLLVLLSVSIRVLVGMFPHSGQNHPPLRGDFEAQRHWLEITSNLPASEWYVGNHSANDLKYWGLDYPPLTAYHSLVLGKAVSRINPSSVALLSSRGAEDPTTKALMRASVILSDLVSYIPAVVVSVSPSPNTQRSDPRWTQALLWVICQPALLLIDHGHFQYNGVCLGLVAAASHFVTHDWQLLGSVLFVMALNFKHMALYFSPVFFVYLLSRNLSSGWKGFIKIGMIGAVVIATFALLWFPFLHDIALVKQVFSRLFPVARGVFEDKVANLWCVLSPLHLKDKFSPQQLFALCAASTLVGIFIPCFMLFRRPSKEMFLPALGSCSMVFFLLAFQVHEKSILMPLLPITIMWTRHAQLCSWAVLMSCFSMYPLLLRDGLAIPYAASMVVLFVAGEWNIWTRLSVLPVVAIHAVMIWVPPPVRLPHLWIMLCMTYCFVMFVLWLLFLLKLQWNQLKQKKE